MFYKMDSPDQIEFDRRSRLFNWIMGGQVILMFLTLIIAILTKIYNI